MVPGRGGTLTWIGTRTKHLPGSPGSISLSCCQEMGHGFPLGSLAPAWKNPLQGGLFAMGHEGPLPRFPWGGPVTTRCHAGPGWITEHGQGLPAPRPKAGFSLKGARTGRTPAAPNPRRESPSRPRGAPPRRSNDWQNPGHRDDCRERVSKARQWDTQGALKGTARSYTNTGSSLATTPLVAARGQRWPVTGEEGVPCRGREPIATGTRSAGATPPAGRCTGR